MFQDNVLKKAIERHGSSHQIRVCIEEMSELTKALCKYERKDYGYTETEISEIVNDIREEIADVMIMARQMAMIFGQEPVDMAIQQKTERLKNRMEETKA